MKTTLNGLAALACALTLTACNGSDWITGGDLVRPGEPTGTLEVVNGTSVNLDAVLISNCDANTYGLNRLSEGDSIAPGDYRDFTVSAGCWDVDGGAIGAGEAKQRLTVEPGGIMQYTITDE